MLSRLKQLQHRLFWKRYMTHADHEFIGGITGAGKTKWIEYKMAKSFEYDKPLCLIDPKGDTYWDMVWWLGHTVEGRYYYEKYKHRILFLNPITGGNNILGFNVLDPKLAIPGQTVDSTAMVANYIQSHLRSQSGMDEGEANRMQLIMNASLAVLKEAGHGKLTMAELPHLFLPSYSFIKGKRVLDTHNPFLASLLPHLDHYASRLFWTTTWPTWTPDDRRGWTQSTAGRIYQQIFDESVLCTSCCVDGRLDFDDLVRQGKWLFVHVPHAVLHDSAIMLGNVIISKIFNACMQRYDGYDYKIVLEEAHYFRSAPIARILATGRGHRLWLSLIAQFIEQMERPINGIRDTSIVKEIRGNIRYITTFNNAEDREFLAALMFGLRGDIVTKVRDNGYEEYMPVPVEENGYQRRFVELKKRQMVIYDRYSRTPPVVKRTPDFPLTGFSLPQAQMFEQSHLAITGTSRSEVKRSITDRLERISGLFTNPTPHPQPTANHIPPIYGDIL